MRLHARLAAIEKRTQPAQLGYRTFTQSHDDINLFYDDTYQPVDYRRGLFWTDRTGQRKYSRAEIAALETAGWNVTLIQFVENWREYSGVLAVVSPGLVNSLLGDNK